MSLHQSVMWGFNSNCICLQTVFQQKCRVALFLREFDILLFFKKNKKKTKLSFVVVFPLQTKITPSGPGSDPSNPDSQDDLPSESLGGQPEDPPTEDTPLKWDQPPSSCDPPTTTTTPRVPVSLHWNQMTHQPPLWSNCLIASPASAHWACSDCLHGEPFLYLFFSFFVTIIFPALLFVFSMFVQNAKRVPVKFISIKSCSFSCRRLHNDKGVLYQKTFCSCEDIS